MNTVCTPFRSLHFALLIVACLFTWPLSAQRQALEKITGAVRTSDGQPAEFVNVVLKDTFYGTTTDAKGHFSFDAPAGDYTMSVFSITCHAKEFPVSVKEGGPNRFADIRAAEDTKQLEAVVVTGQSTPQSLRNSVYKVKVIGSEQIEQKAAPDIQSLLNTEVGIRFTNDMALGETSFELMGMGGTNVKVLIDGIPVVDRGETKHSLSQIDISNVERIEIVEGPMSVVYGTDALAGVINIITKKPYLSRDKITYTVNASVQEETQGKEYEFFDGEGLHRENLNVSVSTDMGLYARAGGTRYTSGGWAGEKTGREIAWPAKDQYLFNGMVGYGNENLNVWYKLDYLNEKVIKHYNGAENTPHKVTDESHPSDRLTQQLQGEWKISSRVILNAAASYQNLERRTRTININTETGEQVLSEMAASQDTTSIQSFFTRATVTWRLAPKFTLHPGVDYEWEKAWGDRIEGKPSISDVGIYVSAEWKPLSWLNVHPGLRTVKNSVYSAPPVIPSLQTKFALNESMDLRLSYGYGFKAPKLRQLYFAFSNINHDITGNDDLKAEHSNNVMAAFTWRILHYGDLRLTSTVSGYFNEFRNQIAYVTIDANASPMKITYGNLSRTKTTGGAIENSLVWKNLHATLSFGLIGKYNDLNDEAANKDRNMKDFRFTPELSANVSYKFEKTGTSLSLYYKYNHKKEQYAISNNQVTLQGLDTYHWADFTVSQKVWDYITLSAGVKNIFDVTYVENTYSGGGMGSSGTKQLIGSGRSFFAGINFALTK